MIQVGFAEVNITPEPGLRMAGMPNPPRAEGVHWPLFGRIVVFGDGEHQAALVTLDLLFLLKSTVAELRAAMTTGTDLAPSSVMITCTHTHRGPFTASLMDVDVDFAYIDLLRERLAPCMAQALGARQPAHLSIGQIDAPGWTFNRRPVYQTMLGEQVGTQGPVAGENFLRMEGPEDNQLQVLTATSLSGQVLGGLVGFACHTTVMGREPVYSADFPGPLTEILTERHGGIFAFVQGACGNLWPIDMRKEQPFSSSGIDHAQRMAVALADKADEAIAQGRPIAAQRIVEAHQSVSIGQRRPTREQVNLARWYLEEAPPDIDEQEFTRRHYGHEYTFHANTRGIQEWFMRETIGMWEWQRRDGSRELSEDLEVQVIAIGDVAFVGYPGEIFCEFGLKTKQHSPFPHTFTSYCANGWHGYLPTQQAFEHGGYEPRFGYVSRLAPEAADRLYDAAIHLLHQVAEH